MVGVYKEIYEFLEAKVFKTKLKVTNNRHSKKIQHYISSQEFKWQLVQSNNHRVNAA